MTLAYQKTVVALPFAIGECGEKDNPLKAGVGQGPTEIGRLSGQNSGRSGYTRRFTAKLKGCLDKLNGTWALELSENAGSSRVSSEGKRKDLSLRISKEALEASGHDFHERSHAVGPVPSKEDSVPSPNKGSVELSLFLQPGSVLQYWNWGLKIGGILQHLSFP
ncbi:zinc ribbon domain protein [Striga asiatica]|uniref:Zinc ribbon domain protein n=1 Tax=Striga asiatica TaxID=4170 RepID=A0A5A7QIT8_STRAF|nr:zinc ribbon domain protein [Striga asiatica]